ncbi:hypothetical protein BCR37DRAFT_393042 [Protomyces lactucae-debilis]|uniref:Uncharacterized protein n=1 Tax=Protomyces lactucae-debilis TaxID=2754530 RepID=A0A1Y2FEG0_PROLT|nr:uncharacterized protein BCR37DRAFT_393042 [Protomyces lactucae-debilis]ORY81997.1 hypothetical protein BCR37DRAFT_393042 [Protomyces lactucae-debilis]
MSAGRLLKQAGIPVPNYFAMQTSAASTEQEDDDILHDLVEFCEYFEQRPELSRAQQHNVQTVMLPGLDAMRAYFAGLQHVENLDLLKLIGKWVGHLRNLLAGRKDLDRHLKRDLEEARRKSSVTDMSNLQGKLKTCISALCVSEMLKELTPARPLSDQTVSRARHAAAIARR